VDQNELVGCWKLVSLFYKADDGSSFYPYGKKADGNIIYDLSGYMSAVIARTDRAAISTEDFGLLRDEEKLALAKGFMSYTGSYQVLNDRILHKVEIGYIPNWVGSTFVRFPSFENGTLILTTPPVVLRGKSYAGYLIWKKRFVENKTSLKNSPFSSEIVALEKHSQVIL